MKIATPDTPAHRQSAEPRARLGDDVAPAEPRTGGRADTRPSKGTDATSGPLAQMAGAWLTIDLDAVAANYRHVRSACGGARTAGVVKADGYGIGAVRVARRLAREGCDLFFVAHFAEALALRDRGGAGVDRAEVAVLNGVPPGCEAQALRTRIAPVLNGPDDVTAWHGAVAGRTDAPGAYLQIETGMNRLGLDGAGLEAVRPAIEATPLAGIMSHFACADDPNHPMNARQLDRFTALAQSLPAAPLSLANSAGALGQPPARFDMVRPGIALYGGNPFAARANPLTPVVRLTARVLQCRWIDAGAHVGYAAAYTAQSRRRVATLSAGYADGYLRAAGGNAAALVETAGGSVQVPLIGRISMDLITIDVTDVPADSVKTGTMVTLIGGAVDVDAVGEAAGTFGYEILTSLGPRYARTYLGEV